MPARDKQEIDLTGPDGNAFVLLGHAKRLSTTHGMDGDKVCADMMNGDYEHLVRVFDSYFGHVVTLYR